MEVLNFRKGAGSFRVFVLFFTVEMWFVVRDGGGLELWVLLRVCGLFFSRMRNGGGDVARSIWHLSLLKFN